MASARRLVAGVLVWTPAYITFTDLLCSHALIDGRHA